MMNCHCKRNSHCISANFISGGSLVKFLTTGLPTIQDTDLRKWLFFFCDERLVTVDDPESTFGTYKRELLGKIDIKIDQFVTIKQGVSAKDAALDYIEKLEKHFGKNAIPEFDLLLLGMGPDGHTCSLFPGHQLLNETTSWVCAITDSPKPPPERITLTFPVINNAKCCVFAISGASKADMVKVKFDTYEILMRLVFCFITANFGG